MEGRMYKIFGVVITFLLVFSLAATFAVTTPVAAGTQKWSEITMPGDKMQVLPNSDISTTVVTPDGKTLFAGVVLNQSTTPDWFVAKSTDDGYTWKRLSGYDALGSSDEQIVAIKVSPDWATDGKIYVATKDSEAGYVYTSKDSGKTWKEIDPDYFSAITSMDVILDESGAVTIVVGTTHDVYLYSDGAWTAQNAGSALAVAFSPNYADDGTIIAVVNDGTNLRLRAETDIEAHNWGNYLSDAYFTYTNGTGVRLAIPAQTACIAFPSDFATTQTVFVGLNSGDGGYTVGYISGVCEGTDGAAPQHQTGDAFKVSLTSGLMASSSVTDLNIRGPQTGTDVWSMAVSGETGTADIICGLRYASQTPSAGILQAQVHTSNNGGESWSPALKPPSGMTAYVAASPAIGLAAPVVVMAPDFTNSSKVYCVNGYYNAPDGSGVGLSGFYVSTDNGATWNGRGLLDRILGASDLGIFPTGLLITDIVPSTQYDTDNTIYMVTQATYSVVGIGVTVGLLWETTDGGAHWEIICDMIPLSTVTSDLNAVVVDKVAVAGSAVFITGYNGLLGGTYQKIFRSTDGGKSFPTSIATYGPVQHLLAIDQNTLITANDSNIYKTTNGGSKWVKADIDLNSGESVSDMVIKGNAILVGTDKGSVYLCDDYASDFSFYQIGSKSVCNCATAGTVVVAFDTNYETNHIIYAGVTGSHSGIWRNVDDSNTWDQLDFGFEWYNYTYIAVDSDISAIACDNNGILWAICTATNISEGASDTFGTALRSVNPTESTVSKVKFNLVETGLTDTLTGNLNVIGSTETFAVGGALNNQIWIYTDTLIKPTLISPSNGLTAAGDLLKGTSFARVVLTWTYLAKADSYQYQVALDQDFNNIVTDSTGALVNGTITGTSLDVQLYAGTKYYWRIRVAAGVNSQWSDVWSFTTPLGPSAEAPALLSPTAGQDDVTLTPVLQWSGLASATKYELQVAKNCDFSGSNLIVDKTNTNALGAVTAYQLSGLTNGTNYCWRVRAVSDLSTSAWSNTYSFTTAQAVVAAAAESTPVWVWVIIALSAVLLVSVVILIIRTRRA